MIKTLFTLLILAESGFAQENLTAIRENNDAVKKLEQEDISGAERHLLNALPDSPFDPVLRLNLGLVYEIQKKYDRALKEYEAVLRSPKTTDEIKFYAHFNAGNAAAQQKNIDQALAHYQAALLIDPASNEVKTNIELLFKQGQGQGQGQNQQGQGQQQSENPTEGQGQGEKDNPQNPDQDKPEFKSQNLSKEDVRKIMEELKSQEKKIRALEYGTKGKESKPGKDW